MTALCLPSLFISHGATSPDVSMWGLFILCLGMCVYAHGGQRTTLGALPRLPLPFCF